MRVYLLRHGATEATAEGRYSGRLDTPLSPAGFTAEYAGGEIRPDGVEITDARFCTPEDMPDIPSPGSIARRLIDQWLNQQQETQRG